MYGYGLQTVFKVNMFTKTAAYHIGVAINVYAQKHVLKMLDMHVNVYYNWTIIKRRGGCHE